MLFLYPLSVFDNNESHGISYNPNIPATVPKG